MITIEPGVSLKIMSDFDKLCYLHLNICSIRIANDLYELFPSASVIQCDWLANLFASQK